MQVKWKKGFAPDVILKKLSEISVSDGETVSFNSLFEYKENIAVLKSMIEIDSTIPLSVGHALVKQGLHNAVKQKNLESKIVLSEINKAVQAYIAKPDQIYYLVTTLNIGIFRSVPSYSLNGCFLRFYLNLPRKFRKARRNAFNIFRNSVIDKDDYTSYYLCVRTKARSNDEAGEKMLDAINILRGIWNLQTNYQIALHDKDRPINRIVLGALHSLHEQNGALINDIYWYQPDYIKNYSKINLTEEGFFKSSNKIRNKLKKLKYRNEIENAIIRYVNSLDSKNYNVSFIELWSLIETLTSTLRDNYEKTINRAVFLFKDREYHKQVLEHLRQYRNRYVHSGSEHSDLDILIYQLKYYVEVLLLFLIDNPYRFSGLQEASDFMDLNPDVNVLRNKISLFKKGIKFRSG